MVLILAATVLVALLAGVTIAVVREVRLDGFGQRPAPSSVQGWGVAAMPSAPYRAQLDR